VEPGHPPREGGGADLPRPPVRRGHPGLPAPFPAAAQHPGGAGRDQTALDPPAVEGPDDRRRQVAADAPGGADAARSAAAAGRQGPGGAAHQSPRPPHASQRDHPRHRDRPAGAQHRPADWGVHPQQAEVDPDLERPPGVRRVALHRRSPGRRRAHLRRRGRHPERGGPGWAAALRALDRPAHAALRRHETAARRLAGPGRPGRSAEHARRARLPPAPPCAAAQAGPGNSNNSRE